MCTGLADVWLLVNISGLWSGSSINTVHQRPWVWVSVKTCLFTNYYSHINPEWCTWICYTEDAWSTFNTLKLKHASSWLFSFRGLHVLDVEGDFLFAAVPVRWLCKNIIVYIYLQVFLRRHKAQVFVSILFPQTRMDTKPTMEIEWHKFMACYKGLLETS